MVDIVSVVLNGKKSRVGRLIFLILDMQSARMLQKEAHCPNPTSVMV